MKKHNHIQYIEFLSRDLPRIKNFYSGAFGWVFTDYGPEYTAFEGEGVDGGFTIGDVVRGSMLVILYSERLDETRDAIVVAGGIIVRDTYSFPGGRRFHFADPDGNELAVWSDT
jgi:hypothetical protein